MNQHEASGSDDDMDTEEDRAMDELAAAVIEEEGLQPVVMDPATKREQDIIAEVARRRAARDASETKRKSDEIFARFDADRDELLNFSELAELGQATGGELHKATYKAICEEIGADPKKGVTRDLLLTMYTDAGLGDAHRDYNLIFRS
jgi:hypothetical protein